MIREAKIEITGDFCTVHNKRQFKYIKTTEAVGMKGYIQGVIECKIGRNTYQLMGYGFVMNTNKDFRINSTYLGRTHEMEGGFTANYVYHNIAAKKLYKNRKDAENRLISENFKKYQKAIFGYLAQQQFYYSDNYIHGKSVQELGKECKEAFRLEEINLHSVMKIVKKYFRSNVTGYYGQGGYKIGEQIFN